MRVVYEFEEQLGRRHKTVAQHPKGVGNVAEAKQPRLPGPLGGRRPLRKRFLAFPM